MSLLSIYFAPTKLEYGATTIDSDWIDRSIVVLIRLLRLIRLPRLFPHAQGGYTLDVLLTLCLLAAAVLAEQFVLF